MAEADQVAVQAWADAQGLPVEFSGTHDESELLLSVMDWARHPANLLQGRFASRQQVLVPPALRIAAIFLLVAFSVQLVSEWARYAYYSNQAEKSQAAAITLYKKLFPNERRIVSVRKQMEAHLNEGSGGDGGLPVLTKIAEAVQGSGLVAQRVDFASGVLTLDIEARGLTEIDALKQKLQDVGLQAEIVSANAQNGAIRGRLRVETGA
jgi:type II secretion system protein L